MWLICECRAYSTLRTDENRAVVSVTITSIHLSHLDDGHPMCDVHLRSCVRYNFALATDYEEFE